MCWRLFGLDCLSAVGTKATGVISIGCGGEGVDALEPCPAGVEAWNGRARLRPGFTDWETTFTAEGSEVPEK